MQRMNVEGSMLNADSFDGRTIDIVLVTAPRCHFCEDTAQLLADLASDYPLSIRTVALASDEGTAIARRHSVPFPPVLLVDDVYFGHGRISRRKLTKALDQSVLFFPPVPHPQGGS